MKELEEIKIIRKKMISELTSLMVIKNISKAQISRDNKISINTFKKILFEEKEDYKKLAEILEYSRNYKKS